MVTTGERPPSLDGAARYPDLFGPDEPGDPAPAPVAQARPRPGRRAAGGCPQARAQTVAQGRAGSRVER